MDAPRCCAQSLPTPTGPPPTDPPDGAYDGYLRQEWARFMADPARAAAVREALGERRLERVLDLGCGAGQELIPFIASGAALGVGIDIAPGTGRAARELWSSHLPAARIRFVRGAAEALPLRDGSFDAVVCRIALPYMDNARAIGEMARVLRARGLLFLKIHHLRFYLGEARRAAERGDGKALVHVARVLVAGAAYHLTGRQPRNRVLGGETFQSRRHLRRELARHGLTLLAEMPDSVPDAPSFLVGRC